MPADFVGGMAPAAPAAPPVEDSHSPPVRLSAGQLRQYDDEGYVVVPSLVSGAELRELQSEAARLIDAAAGLRSPTSLHDLEPEHTPSSPRVRRVKRPDLHSAAFLRLLRHPAVLSAARQLLRADGLRFLNNKLNVKPPHGGSALEWHQDWAFYPHTNQSVLAVALLLDDVDADNAPTLIIPGTHKGPLHDHHARGVFVGGISDRTHLDLGRAVAVKGSAGTCSFHHARAVHGSAPNRSGRGRRVLFTELAAADAWPLLGLQGLTLAQYDAKLLCGRAAAPRMEAALPVRLPLPPPPARVGSIYDSQRLMPSTHFPRATAAQAAQAARL